MDFVGMSREGSVFRARGGTFVRDGKGKLRLIDLLNALDLELWSFSCMVEKAMSSWSGSASLRLSFVWWRLASRC